jgi:uncharacterized iron-regulated protein
MNKGEVPLNYLMTNKAQVLSRKESFEILIDFDVIFVGEIHDSRFAHEAELTLLTGLSKGSDLVLALRCLSDVQDTLDAYLKGISENRLLNSRAPAKLPGRLSPLRISKDKRIPVLAPMPRRAAAAVAMANKISPKVVGEDRLFLPQKVHLDSREYRKRFLTSMVEMPHHTPMKGMSVNGLYKAQVLKDAVMAASLETLLDRRILFCCGHFHSDYRLGIPYQLQKNHPELKIAVIAFSSSFEELPMKDRSRVADFIWLES